MSTGELTMGEDGKFTIRAGTGNNINEPRLVTFSRAFLIVINILTSAGGLALAGVGVYVFIEFNARFSGLLSENAAIGGIVAGILISMGACFGIFGIVTNNLRLLLVYSIVSLAFLITILSILGLFVEYINTVSQVSAGLSVFSERQVEVNDFFASAYTKCCVQNSLFCFSAVPNTEGYCPPVPFCANRNGTETCYAGNYGATPNDPPKVVFQEFCGTLVAFNIAGPSSTTTGACGFPNGATGFMQQVFGWVTANVQYPYICIGLLSAIIFLDVCFGLYLCRYIHLSSTGQWNDLPSPRKAKSSRSARQVEDNGVIALQDHFRFNEDEFDATLRDGISANDPDGNKHKSAKWQSGNPVFRSLFGGAHAKKIPDATPVLDDV